ncbi:hypothetical protein H2200_012191 [Cladophialophora chaetospira]|uniref:Uncharacterized protein n=1 Tax=Cladophialophora chaetospira TaxID=386627 RepID=A0AA38WYE0_9EURO|nr:hypothetical protein H2200_012191 [Cladophialophora chaetospira]
MTMDPSAQSGSLKSLKDMSAAKYVEVCHEAEDALPMLLKHFERENEREKLLPYLWQEHIRLLEVERKYKALEEHAPAADRLIHFTDPEDRTEEVKRKQGEEQDIEITNGGSDSKSNMDGDESHSDDDVLQKPNPYTLRDNVVSKWRYRTTEDRTQEQFGDHSSIIEWDNGRLMSGSETSLRFCEKCWGTGWFCDNPVHVSLPRFITSQLLLYRLLALFGRQPMQEEAVGNEWGVWELVLTYREDTDSKLFLSDYLGIPECYFYGSKEASYHALDLINFLVSDGVPHVYEPFLAGTEAPEEVFEGV